MTTYIPPRPTLTEEFAKPLILEFVTKNREEFQELFDDEDDPEDVEYAIKSIANDLFKALEYARFCLDEDIMNYLIKDEDWNFSDTIWNAVQSFTSFIQDKLNEAEKQWVAENHIQPPYPIGATVKNRRGEIFTIVGIDEYSPASYLLRNDNIIAKLGENAARIVKFEDVELVGGE